jgi:hypothetical protein
VERATATKPGATATPEPNWFERRSGGRSFCSKPKLAPFQRKT